MKDEQCKTACLTLVCYLFLLSSDALYTCVVSLQACFLRCQVP